MISSPAECVPILTLLQTPQSPCHPAAQRGPTAPHHHHPVCLYTQCQGKERGGKERGGKERGGKERGGKERGGKERGGKERGGREGVRT